MTENPFFEIWSTPFGLPPFDRIRAEHFPPAFDRAMAEHNAEIAAITGSAAPPTFANTIEALERSGRLLDRVSRVFFNLDSSNTNDELEAIARDHAPKLAQHQMQIALNERLFERISELYARRETLGLAVDQNLGPEVGIIAGGIAASGEQMLEMRRAMAQANLSRHADPVEKFALEPREIQFLRRRFAVKLEVEQRGARVLYGRETLVDGSRREQPAQQFFRDRFSSLVVPGVTAQCLRR